MADRAKVYSPLCSLSCVKQALLTTNQTKHATLDGILAFHNCFQGHYTLRLFLWFIVWYAVLAENVLELSLKHRNLSCSSETPLKRLSELRNPMILSIPNHLEAFWNWGANPDYSKLHQYGNRSYQDVAQILTSCLPKQKFCDHSQLLS